MSTIMWITLLLSAFVIVDLLAIFLAIRLDDVARQLFVS
jgi:hypothetical protein